MANNSSGKFGARDDNDMSDSARDVDSALGNVFKKETDWREDATDDAKSVDDALKGAFGKQAEWREEPSDSARGVDAALEQAYKNAPWASGKAADGAADDLPAATASSDDEFVGSGGVGSPEFMERLRKGHQEAGGAYNSALGGDDDTQPA